MTFFVMAPTFDRAWQDGAQADDGQSDQPAGQALPTVAEPFREFMLAQVREKDIALFESLSQGRFDDQGPRHSRSAAARSPPS